MERIRIEQGGLKCDNPSCDWQDMSIKYEDYLQYINFPCPKCNENVLTEKDYHIADELYNMVAAFNAMTDEEMKEFESLQTEEVLQENKKILEEQFNINADEISPKRNLRVEFNTHKKLSIKDIKLEE